MATFDMERIMWYNIDNGWREKLYNMTESQETGKSGPGKRFAPHGYKITPNRQKRFTTNLHKIWEYKKPEIVRRGRTNENAHTYIKQREHFVKSLSCGYNIVIILPLAFSP